MLISFASMLSSFLGIAVALPLGIASLVMISNGSYIFGGGGVLVAVAMSFCSTIGLLFEWDLWSLATRIMLT